MGFSLFGKNKQSESDTDSDELKGKAAPRRRRKSAEEPVDPVLPEKKRARRRLVGAAAMVLAAIIGLPMLMESEPQPLSDDVQIYIPSVEKPVTDASIASAIPAEQTSLSNITPVDQSSQEPVENKVVAPAEPAAKSSPAQISKPETAKPEISKASSAKSSTESERIAQVTALLEGRSAATASPKPAPDTQKGKFVLQVAALASADKVKELQDRLSKAGISTYTEKVKVSNGEQIRVRVGPFASREEADKMRSKLSGMGLNGMVVPI